MELQTDKFTMMLGDCLERIKELPDNLIDSCVTDPPYHLTSVVKRFGKANSAPAKHGTDGAFARASKGFMGQEWDGGDIAFRPETWAEVFRVLKPCGDMIAFSGSRSYHRMACAIEDAGFEIRDQIMWLYGSGFPKSQNISLAIDKQAGACGHKSKAFNMKGGDGRSDEFEQNGRDFNAGKHDPITEEAKKWNGWGTALKPAHEPMVLARKPLIGTVAANVTEHGTGAINIDGCRVGDDVTVTRRNGDSGKQTFGRDERVGQWENPPGRFPANVMHDGIDEPWAKYFYCPKASKADRGPDNKHPTVKPNELMRYLCRLITPAGGTVLDPFTGSGSTGKAALMEGFKFIGIERDETFWTTAIGRMADAD